MVTRSSSVSLRSYLLSPYFQLLHHVNNYYATEQIVHIFDSIYNIRLNVIQDKVDIIGANYIKCSGAWAVILKATAFFA